MKSSPVVAGNISMLSYALMTAVSSMAIHETNNTVSPLLAAFYTFLLCLLGYNVIAGKLFYKFAVIKNHLIPLLILNITTAICWIFSFISLKYLPPTLFLFIYLGAMPITSSVLYWVQLPRAFLLGIGMIVLAATYKINHLLLGCGLAFLGGASGTIYSIFSKGITTYFNSREILALRFFLTVLVTLTINIYLQNFSFLGYQYYLQFAFLSAISVFIPLWLFQLGITYLPINQAMYYLPLAPVICYILDVILHHTQINLIQCIIVLILFFTSSIKFTKKRTTDESTDHRR